MYSRQCPDDCPNSRKIDVKKIDVLEKMHNLDADCSIINTNNNFLILHPSGDDTSSR